MLQVKHYDHSSALFYIRKDKRSQFGEEKKSHQSFESSIISSNVVFHPVFVSHMQMCQKKIFVATPNFQKQLFGIMDFSSADE